MDLFLVIPLVAVLLYISIRILRTSVTFERPQGAEVRVMGNYSPLLTMLKTRRLPGVHLRKPSMVEAFGGDPVFIEILIITIWALIVGWRYLNFDPTFWPFGSDYNHNIQNFFVWENLSRCGACVFWNGSTSGGSPAFADLFGALLHPLVVVSTLLWGAINGSKVILVGSFWMAGMSQWWLAKVMGLGRVPRLWVAMIAVAGGHLAARMEMGHVVMVLSIATVSLTIPAAVDLALTGKRRSAVLLGVFGGLTLLAGQGYMILGLLFGVVPAFLILLIDERLRLKPVIKEFALSVGIALLISAVYWIPLVHFYGNVIKPGDPYFNGAQPLGYIPFNLVVSDLSFFSMSDVLFKKPMPAMYILYIGWIPVLLAVAAIRLVPRSALRLLAFFLTATLLVFWVSTAELFKALGEYTTMFTGARHPSLISTLAVPLILALSALGLEYILRHEFPRITLTLPSGASLKVGLISILCVLLMFWSLKSVYAFSQTWGLAKTSDEKYQVAEEFKTSSAEWVAVPFGDFPYITMAMESGVKIILPDMIRAWAWKDRIAPSPYIEFITDPASTTAPGFVKTIGGVYMLKHPENSYAMVETSDGHFPCIAKANGGSISVSCDSPAEGKLIVQENVYSGWKVWVDGAPATLLSGKWLSVHASAGEHTYQFRYLPMDAILGLATTFMGILLTIWLYLRPREEAVVLLQPVPEAAALS